jgi:Polyketide cyclase / dehydrase and lipid transport
MVSGFDAMATLTRSITIEAPAERVFVYVDDTRNLARHMSESRSMPMMGSKLKLEIMTREATGVAATYRYSGQMMGLTIDFSETVTKYSLVARRYGAQLASPSC